MVYVGMDVSSKSFRIHAIDHRKKVLWKGEVGANKRSLDGLLDRFGKQKKYVAFEAGVQMKWIALHLGKREDVDRHVVNPLEVKWICSSNGKSDKVDCKKLAELARADMLPRKVHVVEGKVRELRELVSARDGLQRRRVAMTHVLRGYLDQEGYKLPEKFFSRVNWRELVAKMKLGEIQRLIIESYREAMDALSEAEAKITKRLISIKDKRIDLLKTIPSIGEITSRVILSALDDVERFDNRKCVAKYGALTPTLHQTGDSVKLGSISRNGRQEMRKVLLQCAHSIARVKSHEAKPLKDFFARVERRKGKKKAIVALARKLLVVSYGVLKTGECYDPTKLAA